MNQETYKMILELDERTHTTMIFGKMQDVDVTIYFDLKLPSHHGVYILKMQNSCLCELQKTFNMCT